jgi:hypothetical protein
MRLASPQADIDAGGGISMSRIPVTAVAVLLMVAAPALADDSPAVQQEVQTAELDLQLATVRLNLARAKMHLQQGEIAQSRSNLETANKLLDALADRTDVAAYRSVAQRIQTAVDRVAATRRHAATPVRAAETAEPTNADDPQPAPRENFSGKGYGDPNSTDPNQPSLQEQVDMAVELSRNSETYNIPAENPGVETLTDDPKTIMDRTTRNQRPWDAGRYAPVKELVDRGKLIEWQRARLHMHGVLADLKHDSHQEQMIQVEGAKIAPRDPMNYPSDWEQIKARRAKYADGVLWKSGTFTDGDGKQKQIVAYDVSDLLHVPSYQSLMYNVQTPASARMQMWMNRPEYWELFLYGPFSDRSAYGGPGAGPTIYDVIPPMHYPREADPIWRYRYAQRRAWLLGQVSRLLSTVDE